MPHFFYFLRRCILGACGLSLLCCGLWNGHLRADERLDWERFDRFQGHFTAEYLRDRLDRIYAPLADWSEWIELTEDAAWFRMGSDRPHRYYRLELRRDNVDTEEESSSALLFNRPLHEWRIAIDPGHIGGEWGPMEGRSFQIGDGPVVQEGDLVLAAAHRLAAKLRDAGAAVYLLRESAEPVTSDRPEDLLEEARRQLTRGGADPDELAVRRRAELLFYRRNEILARAHLVNREIRPDVVLALHIDAAPWQDAAVPALVDRNGGHILVNGGFMPGELRSGPERHAMVTRLLNGYDQVEIPLAEHLVEAMVEQTGLGPIRYQGNNAAKVNGNPYIWARNLLANRIFDAPVVYLEPWLMNSVEVYPWAALGDYDGIKMVGEQEKPSLPVVYADFVFAGLLSAILVKDEEQGPEN